MKNTLKITLKPNEKVYVNGAVIRTDRKVALEFLNDVDFLLEGHVLQPEDATTPLRQLYFIVQVILMTPGDAGEARQAFRRALPMLFACFTDDRILSSLKYVDRLVSEGQVFEALKQLRGLYGVEAEILESTPPDRQMPLAMAVGE
jgi:flagellar biosynthesis repressor protein FlbT